MCSIYNILNAIYLEHNKPITKKKKKELLLLELDKEKMELNILGIQSNWTKLEAISDKLAMHK